MKTIIESPIVTLYPIKKKHLDNVLLNHMLKEDLHNVYIYSVYVPKTQEFHCFGCQGRKYGTGL